jgi:type I restriction enzyme M protein
VQSGWRAWAGKRPGLSPRRCRVRCPLKATIKSTEAKKDKLVEQARLKISKDQAQQVIVEQPVKLLLESYRQYLRADQRACVAKVENLSGKYAVTAKQIEAERDDAAKVLQDFLVEPGYE